jgi:hypothetical protein
MSVSDNTKFNEMNELLQQLKDLHAPDRCEGPGNFVWHSMQRFANIASGKKTDQQKITDYWNSKDLDTKRSQLKTLASKSLHDFYFVCREVDEARTVAFFLKHEGIWQLTNGEEPDELTTKKNDLNAFIDGSDTDPVLEPSQIEVQVQKMFDIMIVQLAWRGRMLTAWGIH